MGILSLLNSIKLTTSSLKHLFFTASATTNEWVASNRIPALYAKCSGMAMGQILQTSRCEKIYGGNSFRRPMNDFGERSTLFSTQFYQKSISAILIRGKCMFLFE